MNITPTGRGIAKRRRASPAEAEVGRAGQRGEGESSQARAGILCGENTQDKRRKEQRKRRWGNTTEQMHRLSAPTSNKIPVCKPKAMSSIKRRAGLREGVVLVQSTGWC